jgi:uncharacterized protein
MKALGFAARWLGPVLVLLGLANSLRGLFGPLPYHPFFPFAAILPGLGALVSTIAWFVIRSSERRTDRIVLAGAAIGGILFCVWTYWDQVSAYREVTVSFENRGARLVGTLYLPNRHGKVPGMVIVHGSGSAPRLTYKLFSSDHFVRAGYAVLAYDKRGVGGSSGRYEGGDCNVCPENVDLLGSDASAALSFLAAQPEVEADKVGFWGISQAGWIVPKAAVLNGHAAFMILVSGPTTTAQQQRRYSNFTQGRDPGQGLTPDQAEAVALRTPATFDFPDFDPLPDLGALSVPGLWLLGDKDWLVPPGSTIAHLQELAKAGKPYTYRIFPGAGHGILPTSIALYYRTMDDWLSRVVTGNASAASPANLPPIQGPKQ